MKCKIISLFLLICIFISAFSVGASALTYTEYTEFTGTAISTSVANYIDGFAYNIINSDSFLLDYRYYIAVRTSQYEYLIYIFENESDFTFANTIDLNKGKVFFYNERFYTYTADNRTYYQAAFYETFESCTLRLHNGYVIGNIPYSVNYSHDFTTIVEKDNLLYLQYLLYVLFFFLLIFVAFKFLNKRWLLP